MKKENCEPVSLTFTRDHPPVIAVDDVDVFFYVWEDTFSAIQNFEEPAEGLYSLEWFSKGRGWWGGGIHHTTGSFDISMYNTLHLAMRSSSAEMADITVGMVSVDSTSDATVQAADYGWTADGTWHTIEIPLADFEAAGAELTAIETPLFLVGENATTEGESIWFDDIYLTDHVGSTAIDDGDGDDGGGDGKQTPLLENGGFETFSAGSDGVNRPDVWEVYPTERSNWSSSDPTQSDFTALEGEAALMVWGAGTGSENETAIYQTFEPVNGATYTLTGSAWMPAFDPISDTHTYAMLQVKMFNSSWGMVDSFESAAIDLKTSVDTWTSLTASGTACPVSRMSKQRSSSGNASTKANPVRGAGRSISMTFSLCKPSDSLLLTIVIRLFACTQTRSTDSGINGEWWCGP